MVFVSCGTGGAEMFKELTEELDGVGNIVLTQIAKNKNPKGVLMTLEGFL